MSAAVWEEIEKKRNRHVQLLSSCMPSCIDWRVQEKIVLTSCNATIHSSTQKFSEARSTRSYCREKPLGDFSHHMWGIGIQLKSPEIPVLTIFTLQKGKMKSSCPYYLIYLPLLWETKFNDIAIKCWNLSADNEHLWVAAATFLLYNEYAKLP